MSNRTAAGQQQLSRGRRTYSPSCRVRPERRRPRACRPHCNALAQLHSLLLGPPYTVALNPFSPRDPLASALTLHPAQPPKPRLHQPALKTLTPTPPYAVDYAFPIHVAQ